MRLHFVFLALLVVSSAAFADDRPGKSFKGSFLYDTPDRAYFYEFKDGELRVGTRFEGEGPFGGYVTDCSDDNFKCAALDQNVFAVPRGPLIVGRAYTIRGTVFTVLDCLHSKGPDCQVALIQADCQHVRLDERLRECRPYDGGRDKSPHEGPLRFFVFNKDYGIVSFGSGRLGAVGPERELASQQYVLRGDVGLFKE